MGREMQNNKMLKVVNLLIFIAVSAALFGGRRTIADKPNFGLGPFVR
jgi:hypothetical protein